MSVDFAYVSPEHKGIDARLHNWARWLSVRPVGMCSPMFRQFRSSKQWEPITHSVPVDKLDAAQVEKAVCALPEKHRKAVVWCYLERNNPSRACRALGVAHWELGSLINSGRQMLINRGVDKPFKPVIMPTTARAYS